MTLPRIWMGSMYHDKSSRENAAERSLLGFGAVTSRGKLKLIRRCRVRSLREEAAESLNRKKKKNKARLTVGMSNVVN
eukprot:scaffold294_cov221-Amphora_coffeaeformis.AAC.34